LDREIGRFIVPGQPRQKVIETHVNKLSVLVCVYNPCSLGGIIRRIVVLSQSWAKSMRPNLRNN
jgi:hypothetical protein